MAYANSCDAIERHTKAVGSTSAEVDRIAVTPIGDAHRQRAAAVDDAHRRATWQERVRGADAPVLVDATAVRGASVKLGCVYGCCHGPSNQGQRLDQCGAKSGRE